MDRTSVIFAAAMTAGSFLSAVWGDATMSVAMAAGAVGSLAHARIEGQQKRITDLSLRLELLEAIQDRTRAPMPPFIPGETPEEFADRILRYNGLK